jgi:hypothetical protein
VVVFILLILSLTSCSVNINLSDIYKPMINQPANNERVIGNVSVTWEAMRTSRCHHERCDVTWRLPVTVFAALGTEKHYAEPFMDQLLIQARALYPNENVSLRNASLSHSVTAAGCTPYFFADVITTQPMPSYVTHTANISISQTQGGNILSVDGSVIGQVAIRSITREDLYRRAHNYLTDTNHRATSQNAERQTVIFQQTDMGLGRIRGIIKPRDRHSR